MKMTLIDIANTYTSARYRCRHCQYRTNSEEQMHAHILMLTCPAGSRSYYDRELV